MPTPLKARKEIAMALLVVLFFLLKGATVSPALADSPTTTGKSLSGKTTTVPAGEVLPGTTTTVSLPSTVPARKYQQIEKPPVYKLDIPEYDLAGKLSDVRFEKRNQFTP